ncbi:amyloid-beta-like protein isoform X2 [Adelges cooleyi]|uniref:amyloid-beta-like protein isoform X2 n=1 Tax=Adelges cooleyi TaxID=133065 RepID=UPI0021807B7B|nr:amyloid-beta-like protein isoform X2 [Adelges cooleyi]
MRAVVLCAALFVVPLFALTLKGSGPDGPSPVHFEPQVAVLCDSKSDTSYYSQYMSENGRWTSDTKRKVGCLKEKVDILDYCKKVYPKNDITNIVESSHYVKIGNWCKMGYNKCKHTDWVKPYRCLEGQFQSDALLVPENCIFDHVHNQSKCWPFDRWNQTAAQACQDRDHNLRSFAMLLPCGISLFSGVEFVCCPYKDKIQLKKTAPIAATDSLLSSDQFDVEEDIDDDDDDDDEDDDDVNDEDDDDDDYDNYDDTPAARTSSTTTTTTTTTTTAAPTTVKATTTTTQRPPTTEGSRTTPSGPVRNLPTPDTYFTHFDPRDEHKSYKEALNRLEELHREKVTKVMKDWSDLEERYQEMRSKDPHMAEEFKQRMTLRFQQTVQSLEEEGSAEKHQLFAMHQQRVNAHINQRKKDAMNCFIHALNENTPNTHKVQKCLQKLLRSLHKDRHHTIAHYRHLLASSVELAERERSVTLEHLVDIDHMINQSLQMLDRYPSLSRKISQLMADYIQALRSKDDTPGSLLAMTREAEASILDKYKAEITSSQSDKEHELYPVEKERKELKHEQVESKEAKLQVETAAEFDANDNTAPQRPITPTPLPTTAAKTEQIPAVQHHDHDSEPKISHSQIHDMSLGEVSFSIRREGFHQESRSVYLTLAFAGLSLMAAVFVGVAVIRRRNARLPQNQGFIEVDQGTSQEERHVANMQINGYENPTYKYFEVKEQQ